jgi:hypothetical protein
MRRVLPLALLLLSGCATGPTLAERLSTYVGRSEGDLVAELGVPVRVHEAEGRRFLAFERRRTVAYREPGFDRPFFYGPFGPRWGYLPGPTGYAVLGCDITFALRRGVVESFSLRGEACG